MNLLGYLNKLIKQDCCVTVAFALQEYGASKYADKGGGLGLLARVKRGDLTLLGLVPHEDAVVALRCWARWTVWPKVREALDILDPL
jgi:hypothetical protein